MKPAFRDRAEAARGLAARLLDESAAPCLVLALPRGGVPIAAEIACALQAPLDLLLVRKIGAPWQRELAVAAVVDGEQHDLVIDDEIAAMAGASRAYIEEQARLERAEIERRRSVYLLGRSPMSVRGKTAIVVDDGIATGTTVRAALKALRRRQPARLVLAVPVAPPDTLAALRREVDRVVCLVEPEPLHAISLHYLEFHQVEDAEVMAALAAVDAPGRAAQ